MSSPVGSAKRFLLGKPLANERLTHERLNKKTALAVLSSDAISSVAYATDQILIVLAGALGAAAVGYVFPISAVIVGLLALVGLSYQQTILAYPGGGGSYTVAKENLGQQAGLVAAAALLTDYVLTVSVSVSGGVAAITSAYPSLSGHTVAIGIASIAMLMLVNLRGVRESGIVFSIPTYAFIAMMLLLLALGLSDALADGVATSAGVGVAVAAGGSTAHPPIPPATAFALGFLLLRGFAEGCAAMTGTEAISNGVQAFKPPSSVNAAATLRWMVAILAAFFLGVSYLAQHFLVLPTAEQTVLSQLGHHVFGNGAAYFALQYATFAILILAANTAFADFPRLASILAGDKYVPGQFSARGDRLAFSNGIIALGVVAAALLALFGGNTNALIPLYAIGVFICFTLSQAGMVVHWWRSRSDGWKWRATLNGLGAVATALVTLIQIVTKFTEGGWIVVLLVPLIIAALQGMHLHYRRFRVAVAFRGRSPLHPLSHTIVVPVNELNKSCAAALMYAASLSSNVRVVHVEVDPALTPALEREWDRWDIGFELEVVASPYRSVLRPLAEYVARLQAADPALLVTVVTPELVPRHWWEHFLHNKTALYIRTAFLFKPNVVVVAVPYLVGYDYAGEERGPRWTVEAPVLTRGSPGYS
jgi:amino acid transporter